MKQFMVYTKKGEFVCAVATLNAFVAMALAAKFRLSGHIVRFEEDENRFN